MPNWSDGDIEQGSSEDEYQRHAQNSDDVMTSSSSGEEEISVSNDSDSGASSSEDERGQEFEKYKFESTGKIEKSMGDLPLGERIGLNVRFQGMKRGNAANQRGQGGEARADAAKRQKQTFTREHKHRPIEMSSKRPVSVLRDSTLGLGDGSGILRKNRVRDPRFDSLSGSYSEKAFKKRFSFIFDEKIPEEQRNIKNSLSKIKSATKKEKLERKLQKLTQQLKTEEARRKQEARKQKVVDNHRKATKGQSSKYYLKKSDMKKQELMLKYQELKESGQLEKYMEKRRKKNAAKDHRYLPFSRQ